uniref:Uncharacterized protein n=1 Tax=Anguilla anguilla TaxID=7936 RepID=A0A0E9THF7_ANGAN
MRSKGEVKVKGQKIQLEGERQCADC